jgi:hypothetical protein
VVIKTGQDVEHPSALVIYQKSKHNKLTFSFKARIGEVVRLCLSLADLEFRFLSKLVA